MLALGPAAMTLAAVGAVATLAMAQPPATEPVAPTAKAPIVVASKPISRGHLRHWLQIARRASPADTRGLREQVAGLIISFRWIRGEAAERGIEVDRGEVTRSFRRQRRASFPRRRDFRKFLRESGQTVRDIRSRVQIDLLSDRLRRQATEGAATPAEQQAALDEFVREFRRKWRARTVCRPPWVSESDCGSRASRSR